MERRQRAVEVAGWRLAVEEIGPETAGEGPALVFLHEGLGSIASWRDLPLRLGQRLGLRAVAYDRQGHGGSEPLTGKRDQRYLHEEAEIVLPGLLARLGIEQPVLIGHSDGGTIALLYPGATAALVAIAAHVFVEEVTLAGIRAAVRAYEQGRLAQRLARQHGAKAESLFRAWADTWLAPGFRDWNIEAALPRVRAPLLVIQGAADAYGTAAQVEAIARGVAGPVRVLMLPGVGHAPQLEAGPAVEEAIASFLEGVR